jgi:GAF domain-containing protein
MAAPDATQVAAQRLQHLSAITEAALSHLDLEQLLDVLLDRVRGILESDSAAVLLLDPDANELVARAAKGLEEEVERGVRIPVGAGFAGRVIAEQRAISIPDLERAEVVNPILRERGIRSLLGVPLVVEGESLGVLHVGSLTQRDFSDADAELLQLAGDRIAIAIDHARLYEAERAARREAERQAADLERLQTITDAGLGRM